MTARDLQRRLNLALAIGLAPRPAWGVAFAFIVAHLLVPAIRWPVLVLGVVAAVAFAVGQLRRLAWTESQAAVRLDRLAGAGGLVLTLREVRSDEWAPQADAAVKTTRPPPLQVGRPLLSTLGAAAFTIAAALVQPPQEARRETNAAATSKVEQVEAKADALDAENALTPTLEAELARLRDELEGGSFDAPDWQAADQVADALDAAARERQESLARAEQAAADFQRALDSNTGDDAAARERDALERALQQLGEQLPQREDADGSQSQEGKPGEQGQPGDPNGKDPQAGEGREGEQGQAGQDPQEKPGQGEGKTNSNIPQASSNQRAGKQPQQGGKGPSKEQLDQLRKRLGERQQQLERRFGQRPMPQQGRGEGEGQGQGQAKSGPGQRKPGEGGEGQGDDDADGDPGQGGPSRGGGPRTPLRFGDETKFAKDRLGFAPLPEGAGGEADQLWGLSRSAPRAGQPRDLGDTGTITEGDDGAALRDGPVPPRHRDAVKRYFDPSRRPVAPFPTSTDTGDTPEPSPSP